MWIFSGPWIARGVFTSENALRVNDIETSFNTGRAGIEAFERFKGEIEAIPDLKNKTEVLYDYVHSQLSKMNGEVYSQPLTIAFSHSAAFTPDVLESLAL